MTDDVRPLLISTHGVMEAILLISAPVPVLFSQQILRTVFSATGSLISHRTLALC